MQALTNVRSFIIDMDGVLWHGDRPLPGLVEFFQTLRDLRFPFVLATNNASQTADQYVAKLARMGVAVKREEVLTSAMATALYLAQRTDPRQTRVFVIGEEGLRKPLLDLGFTLTGPYEGGDSRADYVVCGLDRGITWDKLASATLNISAGAKFIGTNPDTTLPTERGVTQGNGAILAAIEAATQVKPVIIGKPEPIMYQQAMALLGVEASETVAIGDRLGTDILGAVRAGIRSLMVLTGISTEEELKTLDYAPDWVMADIREVAQALRKA
ncbi:HAD-IIA family hydrolase [Methylogaea oryzae]|uniref:Acid sugar phosphatase n=1 Tax=Methylogaea oryzae TaxID=1295382 RepID=A0A8D5AJK7_9GAMM|nr:HAD-IIA family hydrolase [Methylogaea oryzae]BBL70156.1 acid sugar phosphatase [Methylogaea oryzae]